MRPIIHLLSLMGLSFLMFSCGYEASTDTSAEKIQFEKKVGVKKTYYANLYLETFDVKVNGSSENSFQDTLSQVVKRLKTPYSGESLKQKKADVNDLLKTNGLDSTSEQYQYEFKVRSVNGVKEPYVGVLFKVYEYTLGAHGSTYFIGKVMNLETQRMISLGDFLSLENNNQKKALQNLIKAHVEIDDYCEIPMLDGDFTNFIIGGNQLVIGFGSYDLGAFSCGSRVVQIPLSELQEVGLLVGLV